MISSVMSPSVLMTCIVGRRIILIKLHFNNFCVNAFKFMGTLPVGLTNVTNVTTLGVVISPRQMSQHQSQHQQQTSNNDKCHRSFSSKNNKRHNVTK